MKNKKQKLITKEEIEKLEKELEGFTFPDDLDLIKHQNMKEEEINKLIKGVDTNKISDGFHTFGELYDFRKVLNAALFNEWHKQGLYDVHKSKRHNDGELAFGGGWFIVVAMLPQGQISFHYEEKDWDLFKIPEEEKAIHPFDGHTSADVLQRITDLIGIYIYRQSWR